MRLIVIGSNSSGNSYALDAGGEILLLEAGCKFKEVQKAIGFRAASIVGCCISHIHGDHCKYSEEYAAHGVHLFGCAEFLKTKQTKYCMEHCIYEEQTFHIEGFDVVPFHNFHDVEIYGYLIRHPLMGTLLFSTDSFKLGMTLRGINHFLIEANYEDSLLKENVRNGSISKAQSDRIMLSHMSLNYCIEYLRDCEAEKSAKTITLCHLSERNSDPAIFRNTVAGAFGVPTFIAQRGTVIELNKDVI